MPQLHAQIRLLFLNKLHAEINKKKKILNLFKKKKKAFYIKQASLSTLQTQTTINFTSQFKKLGLGPKIGIPFVFVLISKKIILKKPHENIRQNREYKEGNIKREKKMRKQEYKRNQQKTNYKEEN